MEIFYEQNYAVVYRLNNNILEKKLKENYQADKFLNHELQKEFLALANIQSGGLVAIAPNEADENTFAYRFTLPEAKTLRESGDEVRSNTDITKKIAVQLLILTEACNAQKIALKPLNPDYFFIVAQEIQFLPLEISVSDFSEHKIKENLKETAILITWLFTGSREERMASHIADKAVAQTLQRCFDGEFETASAMLEALQKKVEQRQNKVKTQKIALIALVVLIVCGAAAGGYWYWQNEQNKKIEIQKLNEKLKEEDYAAEIANYKELVKTYQGIANSSEIGREVVVRLTIHSIDTVSHTFIYSVIGRGEGQKNMQGTIKNSQTLDFSGMGEFGIYKNKFGKIVLANEATKTRLLEN